MFSAEKAPNFQNKKFKYVSPTTQSATAVADDRSAEWIPVASDRCCAANGWGSNSATSSPRKLKKKVRGYEEEGSEDRRKRHRDDRGKEKRRENGRSREKSQDEFHLLPPDPDTDEYYQKRHEEEEKTRTEASAEANESHHTESENKSVTVIFGEVEEEEEEGSIADHTVVSMSGHSPANSANTDNDDDDELDERRQFALLAAAKREESRKRLEAKANRRASSGTDHSVTATRFIGPHLNMLSQRSESGDSGQQRSLKLPNTAENRFCIQLIYSLQSNTPTELAAQRAVLSDLTQLMATQQNNNYRNGSSNGRKMFECHVFGSRSTGLAIPGSDIDVAVLRPYNSDYTDESFYASTKHGKQVVMPSFNLACRMLQRARHNFGNIRRIAHARVPILKVKHCATDSDADVSFVSDGLDSSDLIVQMLFIPKMWAARGLIVMVKLLLSQWELDEPSSGGVGSFVVTLLVVFFLLQQADDDVCRGYNLLLQAFFGFYGRHFDCTRNGIDVRGCAVRVFEKPVGPQLHIVNPLDPSRNAASAATKFVSHVLPKFRAAAQLLRNASGVGDYRRLFKRTFEDYYMTDRFKEAAQAVDLLEVSRCGCYLVVPSQQNKWDYNNIYIGGYI